MSKQTQYRIIDLCFIEQPEGARQKMAEAVARAKKILGDKYLLARPVGRKVQK